MVYLANSTIMPNPGWYCLQKTDGQGAKAVLESHLAKGEKVKSYVGYSQTAEYMSKVLGIDVEVNRQEFKLSSGDTMIICKLKYRVKDPKTKGQEVNPDDFEWYICKFYQGIV